MTAYSKDHCLVQINQCSANSYMIDGWVKKEGALIPILVRKILLVSSECSSCHQVKCDDGSIQFSILKYQRIFFIHACRSKMRSLWEVGKGWLMLSCCFFFNSECLVKIKATSADHGIQWRCLNNYWHKQYFSLMMSPHTMCYRIGWVGLASNPGFPFWISKFLQSCETKSGMETLGARLGWDREGGIEIGKVR